MVGVRKAPILHHFSESVAGAATIRCFNQDDRFLSRNLSLIDDYSRVAFHNTATMEWLCVRINFLFNLVFFLVLVILVSLPRSAISPSKLLFSLLFISGTPLWEAYCIIFICQLVFEVASSYILEIDFVITDWLIYSQVWQDWQLHMV